ncbi:MAG: DUF1653 domain-containing protein [Alphaproteobacteria bacterium]|nr:DUF1653 domain-containing protein [Alphaproteobacteria bacterium]
MKTLETYKHYKGGLYIKLYEALHTETNEELVIYACAVRGEIFARPKSQFYADIQEGDYSGPRFQLINHGMSKEDARTFLKEEF